LKRKALLARTTLAARDMAVVDVCSRLTSSALRHFLLALAFALLPSFGAGAELGEAACSDADVACAIAAGHVGDPDSAVEDLRTSLLQQRHSHKVRANEAEGEQRSVAASDVAALESRSAELSNELEQIEKELAELEGRTGHKEEDVLRHEAEVARAMAEAGETLNGSAVPPEYATRYAGSIPTEPIWLNRANKVAVDEGGDVATLQWTDADKCGEECDKRAECNSFALCGRQCFMKTALVTPSTPTKDNWGCSTYYKALPEYSPADQTLVKPTQALKKFSFYVYRSQNYGVEYPLQNANTASLGGALWYLHNEIVSTCRGDGTKQRKWGDRKFSVGRMRRYKVTYVATQPIQRKGMSFGPLKSFDFGEATGPHRGSNSYGKDSGYLSAPEWDEFGYILGCGYLGEWPHQDWTSAKGYPEAIWFSMPGACPTKPFDKWDGRCMRDYPGGWCSSPTGQGNCTYSFEEAGEIDIDTLVGIKPKWGSRAEFCSRCGSEGGPWGRGGCGLRFWDNIWDRNKDTWRFDRAVQMFKDKYPDSPTEYDLPVPKCDFDRRKYGI